MDSLAYTPASELIGLIRARKVSSVELVQATLARIEQSQPELNAFITVCADAALDAARQADAQMMRGEALGALHGIIYSAKDLVRTAGVRTTFGSLIFEHHVPAEDALAIRRMKAAGAILIGKTTTPEFGQKGLTEAPLFGCTRNAWDPQRTSGGSSGGAAVALAAGLGPLAIGTDGGGSTRIPAACNGVVGFKQGLGVVPNDSANDTFGNISYVTPMARTVLDTALLLDVMAGSDVSDPHSIGRASHGYAQAVLEARDLQGLRIAWRPRLGNQIVARDVLELCQRAVQSFTAFGAQVFELTSVFDNAEELWLTVNGSYRLAQFGHHLAQHRSRMDPTLVAQLERAGKYSAQELYRAIFLRTKLYHQVQAWFEQCDIVVTPTLARTALPIEHQFFDLVEIDGQVTDTMRRAWYPYTLPFNMTGHPAISIPCGWASDGLPVGLQLIAPIGADARLLRAAALFEQAMPWTQRRPALEF